MNTYSGSETLELFYNVYLFIKKYFILFLIFIVAGCAYGVYKNTHQQKTYTREILIGSGDVTYALVRQFTMTLSADIEAGDHKGLAEKMNIDEITATKITSVKVDSVPHKGKSFAVVSFIFSDTSGCGQISQKYTGYLTSNTSLRQIIDGNKAKNVRILEQIDQKLAELDAIQDKGIQSPQLNGSYREYIDLYTDKLEMESKIARGGIEVWQESTTVAVSGFGLIASVIIYCIVFLAFSVIIAFFIDLLVKIRKLEKQRR